MRSDGRSGTFGENGTSREGSQYLISSSQPAICRPGARPYLSASSPRAPCSALLPCSDNAVPRYLTGSIGTLGSNGNKLAPLSMRAKRQWGNCRPSDQIRQVFALIFASQPVGGNR